MTIRVTNKLTSFCGDNEKICNKISNAFFSCAFWKKKKGGGKEKMPKKRKNEKRGYEDKGDFVGDNNVIKCCDSRRVVSTM